MIFYVYASVRVSVLFQHSRFQLVDQAARLPEHKDLRPEDRLMIMFTLERVYSCRAAWVLALSVSQWLYDRAIDVWLLGIAAVHQK